MKYLVSSYTRLVWAVYSGEVGGEVGTRSRVYHRGWEVWVHGGNLLLYVVPLCEIEQINCGVFNL